MSLTPIIGAPVPTELNFLNFTEEPAIYNRICSNLSLIDLSRLARSSHDCNSIVIQFNPKERIEKICAFAQAYLRQCHTQFTTLENVFPFDSKIFFSELWKLLPRTMLFKLSILLAEQDTRYFSKKITKIFQNIDKTVNKMLRLVGEEKIEDTPEYDKRRLEACELKIVSLSKTKKQIPSYVIERSLLEIDKIFSIGNFENLDDDFVKRVHNFQASLARFKLAKLHEPERQNLEEFLKKNGDILIALYTACKNYYEIKTIRHPQAALEAGINAVL